MEKSERIKDKIYEFLDKNKKGMYSAIDLSRELKLSSIKVNQYLDEMVVDNSVIRFARGGRSLIRLKNMKEYD